jgi:hypothetical protein
MFDPNSNVLSNPFLPAGAHGRLASSCGGSALRSRAGARLFQQSPPELHYLNADTSEGAFDAGRLRPSYQFYKFHSAT